MRYFLTGATGFIGGALARQLRAQGHDVTALVRDAAAAEPLAQLGIALAKGDITDRSSLQAMAGADGVFHLAAWYKVGVKAGGEARRINVEGTRNVLQTARDLGIPKTVYTSTLAVFSDTKGQLVNEGYRYNGPHLSEYDRTKWEAQYEVAEPLQRAGMPLVIVQPGVTYGPGDRSNIHALFQRYLARKLPMIPAETEFCWGHVEDTALGHQLAMEKGKPGENYIIAGHPATLVEVFELAEKITGVRAPTNRPAPDMIRAMAKVTGLMGKVMRLPPEFHPEALRVSAGTTYIGDNSKAKKVLGLQHRPLEQGLRETLAWEMEQLGMRPSQ
ncbi:MAG TPA: NAD-dependent epimerase/dehydratase family protein [bacterium]|nr:NAD-dependent epimerase/dehydratase family protein [bacterium]